MSNKIKKKQFKQIQNQAQDGRSMIEMLGVLAIIGVLSIGGIVGYKLAMNHYQANQIVHEMNMMRTDAQIKIAQGAENLTLGSPYDEHKINFNGYKTNFDCALANEEEVILNDVSCYAANAYYIELQEIPEDVCQPLVRLINGMDNLIDFYVNEPDAEGVGKDTCDEGNNTLTAIFGADSDSNAIKCDDADECPENLPVCLNHVCVECETYHDCQGETPQCDEASHTCKSCAEIDPEKPLWDNNECKACPEDEPWNGEFCGCRNNDDCESDEFCLSTDCSDCYSETTGCKFKCKSLSEYTEDENPYTTSNQPMNWWSAERFCKAYGQRMAAVSNLKCNNTFNNTGEEGTYSWGYCHKIGSELRYGQADQTNEDVSNMVKELLDQNNGKDVYYWLQDIDIYDDAGRIDFCHMYHMHLHTGYVDGNENHKDTTYALCVSGED